MSESVLCWVADALRAERESLDSMLEARHADFMKALAGELDGVQWKNGAPSVEALGSSSWSQRADVDVDKVKEANLTEAIKPFSITIETNAKQAAIQEKQAQVPQAQADNFTPGEEDVPPDNFREKVKNLLKNNKYETAIGFVILTNSITMGIEAQFEVKGWDLTAFNIMEHFFLFCYIFELCMWYYAYGRQAIKNGWVAFDTALVAFGVLGTYVIEPLLLLVKDSGNESLKDTLAGLLVLRIVRLFRLARIVRVLIVFKTLWMLVRGLMGSCGTMVYTMSLIFVMIYMFACMAIEVITKKMSQSSNPEVSALVEHNFKDLPTTMLSLLQFVSMDSISSLYFPLIVEDPFLIVFFLPFILIVSVSLMNLVTAVIVEGALEQGKQDREATARYKQYEVKKMHPHLKEVFHQIDQNGDNSLTRAELLDAPVAIRTKLQNYLDSDAAEALEELFDLLDVDGSGEVDIDEFCDGIANLVNSDAPVQLIRVMKQLKTMRKEMFEIFKALKEGGGSDFCT